MSIRCWVSVTARARSVRSTNPAPSRRRIRPLTRGRAKTWPATETAGPGEGSDENQAVQVAGMVGDDHGTTVRWQVLCPAYGKGRSREPGEGAHARAGGPPPPGQPGQYRDEDERRQANGYQEHPAAGGVADGGADDGKSPRGRPTTGPGEVCQLPAGRSGRLTDAALFVEVAAGGPADLRASRC